MDCLFYLFISDIFLCDKWLFMFRLLFTLFRFRVHLIFTMLFLFQYFGFWFWLNNSSSMLDMDVQYVFNLVLCFRLQLFMFHASMDVLSGFLFMFLWVSADHAYSALLSNVRMYSQLSGMENTISIHVCPGCNYYFSLTWCLKMCFLSKKGSFLFLLYWQWCVYMFSSSILYLLSIFILTLMFYLVLGTHWDQYAWVESTTLIYTVICTLSNYIA
jgi:hypothetical protein